MILKELLAILHEIEQDYEVYARSPDGTDDFFVDSIYVDDGRRQIFINTSQ